MQCRLAAKAWVNVTEVLEQLQQSAALSAALRGHSARVDQANSIRAALQRRHERSAVLVNSPADHQATRSTPAGLQHAISTRASHAQRTTDALERPIYHGRHASEPQHAAEAHLRLENPNALSTPGSVVMGFDGCVTSAQPPSWAPALVQGRVRPPPEAALDLASEELPADPETLFPATPQQTLPHVRHWRDWASRANTVEEWLRLVHNNLLRWDVSPEEVSYVHISSSHHAVAVLLENLMWRDEGAKAPQQVQHRVNAALADLATRIEHWPTCNNHEDVANFLWRMQQLCIVKCPDHMKSLRSSLMELGPEQELSILQRLLGRASSLPIIFEDRISTQRLCGIAYNTASTCPTFFTNLAIHLEASTVRPELTQPSPVLTPRRAARAPPLLSSVKPPPHVPAGPLAAVQGLQEGLDADGFGGAAVQVPRQLALEVAAAAQEPQVAAAQVPPQQAGVATAGYNQRTLNMIVGACANVVQAHGQSASHLKGHMRSIFRSVGQRWVDLIFEGAQSQPQSLTFFLTAHSKCRIPAEPHVLSMMLKQAVIVLKDCDPQGVSTIMSALAFLCNSRDPDARAVFCVAHAQLLRVLRTHMPRTQYAANVSCHASWAFGAMNFAPSLHLSKLLCEAVTDSLQQQEQTLSMQQLCAFLWGLTKVSHLQESAGSRGSGTRLSDVYGGSGRGWQKRKAAPTATQVWQESIMPVVRAAQQPAARHIRTLHPDYARAVSMLMWSHAQLRRQPYAVLTSAVIKHAEECTGAYSMQGSTNLVWALHTLMPTVPAIPRATTQRMASTLTSHGANVLRHVDRDLKARNQDIGKVRMGLQACAVTLSSLVSRHALMGESIPMPLVHKMLRQVEACLRLSIDKFGTPAAHSEISMIQQTFDVLTQLGLETRLEEHAELWKVVGAYVTKSNAPHAFRDTAAPSLLQHSVAACVRKLHSSNWFPPCTTIQEEVKLGLQRYVDIMVTVPGAPGKPARRIAVEVDGPHHFTAALQPDGPASFGRNNTWPDGPTQLRNWSLHRLGLEVVDIRYYEANWKSARFAAESKFAGSASRPSPAMMQLVARKMREVLGPDFGRQRWQPLQEAPQRPQHWEPRLPAGYSGESAEAETTLDGRLPAAGAASLPGKRFSAKGRGQIADHMGQDDSKTGAWMSN